MVAAIVLAAGAATRFGAPKQLLLLPYVLDSLAGAELGRIVVVSGAYTIGAEVLGVRRGVLVTCCEEWSRGPGASLRCGLAALDEEIDAAIVVLADGPYLDSRAIRRVLDRRHDGEIVAASYAGVRGHPLVLARSAWARVPDVGARALPAILVPCDDLSPPGDIDTPELARDL